MIAESAFGAIVTVIIALVLTAWWVDAALSIAPAGIPRMQEVALNARVASFAVVLALFVTAVGNAVPTFRAGRTPIAGALKDGAAVSAGTTGRLRAGLVVAEIAAAVMLLVGAGLLARTFAELRRVDVGFNTSNLLVLRMTPDAARYRTGAQTNDYYRRVLEVASRGARDSIGGGGYVAADEHDRLRFHQALLAGAGPSGRQRRPGSQHSDGDTRIFGTLGLPLIAGREFTDGDDDDAPRVVIVNQKLARAAWGAEDPVGRNLVLDYQRGPYPYEVVGVVRDDRDGPRSEPVPEIFIPHAQNPYLVMNVIARTSLDPMAVAQTARASALRVDPDQPVHSVTTMQQLLGDAVQLDRFAMLLVTLFAIGGLITAAGGVYALLAYTVVQRRREIALRMALGASPRRVARAIVMESLALAVAGGSIGLVAAAASSRFARTMLFGVAPQDPVDARHRRGGAPCRGRGRELAAGAPRFADRPVTRDEDLRSARKRC